MNLRVASASALVCAWGACYGLSVAHAQTTPGRPTQPEAIAHFHQGNARYKLGEFAEAIQEYKAGALIEPAAIFHYNLGQCYRQLAQYKDAIWHYKRYLHSGVATQEEIEAINRWISEMQAELEQRAKSTPPTEPATMRPASQGIVVRGRAEPWYRDPFGWGTTGAGVAVGGVGAWLLVNAASLRSDANMAASQQERNTLRDKADSRSLAGTILAVGGGALVVTGVIKLAIHDSDTSGATQVTFGVSPTGVFAFGRF